MAHKSFESLQYAMRQLEEKASLRLQMYAEAHRQYDQAEYDKHALLSQIWDGMLKLMSIATSTSDKDWITYVDTQQLPSSEIGHTEAFYLFLNGSRHSPAAEKIEHNLSNAKILYRAWDEKSDEIEYRDNLLMGREEMKGQTLLRINPREKGFLEKLVDAAAKQTYRDRHEGKEPNTRFTQVKLELKDIRTEMEEILLGKTPARGAARG